MERSDQIEALGLLEIDGLARAIRAQDAALKRAPVIILACTPVSPGKAILIIAGDVASVEESMTEAEALVGSRHIDRLFLPGIHPRVVSALRGRRSQRSAEALAVLELSSAAATIETADAAVKAAHVDLGRMHLATGFGGKGFFTLWGDQAEVEAGLLAATELGGERVLDHEIIPAPHDELEAAAFRRPWGLDPADDGSEEME
ncbi:MAG: BMC domain-containing protein [Myxococcota bacterium]